MRLILAMILSALTFQTASAQTSQPPTVFAAASLTDVMQEANRLWVAQGHPPIRFNFAASSTLARQMEQGATPDVFISADEQWMNWVAERHLIVPSTRISPLGNTLVLVSGKPDLVNLADLPRLLGDNRLAVGDPAAVPAGRYAREALTKLGLWDALAPRLAPAEDVRAALLLVQRGEAPYGIVYATDAASASGLHVVAAFPNSSHTPVTYPFALGAQRDTPNARALFGFLTGSTMHEVYRRAGFTLLPVP